MPEHGGLDRVRLQPIYGKDVSRPTSFKGTSGGGLWKIFIDRADNGFVQSRLFGVAYYETVDHSELQLVCHGPRSIYSALLREIDETWGPLNLKVRSPVNT